MKDNKLVSMVEFVLTRPCSLKNKTFLTNETQTSVINYALFLSQPLALSMFIPADKDGNVLEKPINYDAFFNGEISFPEFVANKKEILEYHEAHERVLFEGFKVNGDYLYFDRFNIGRIEDLGCYTIEKIINSDIHPTLTASALKSIGV